MKKKLNRHERRMLKARGFDVPEDGIIDQGDPVSEKKAIPLPPRKPEVVQEEYVRVCSALGEKRYQLAVTEAQIAQLIQAVDRLVAEAKKAATFHAESQAPEPGGIDENFEKMKKEILAHAEQKAKEAAEEAPVKFETGHTESYGDPTPTAVGTVTEVNHEEKTITIEGAPV